MTETLIFIMGYIVLITGCAMVEKYKFSRQHSYYFGMAVILFWILVRVKTFEYFG